MNWIRSHARGIIGAVGGASLGLGYAYVMGCAGST